MEEKVQWNPKQYLGDDKVLAMDWDSRGMHFWLLNLSWQQELRGTIPNDTALIRRWLGSPTDEIWRRVWSQISAAWLVQDGRLVNAGMVRAAERQQKYAKTRPKTVEKQGKNTEPLVLESVGFVFTNEVERPIWIPDKEWRAFEEMRVKIRKPMTVHARELIWRKLGELAKNGHDPVVVLNQSIIGSWQDVYPIKGEKTHGHAVNKSAERQAGNVAAIRQAVEQRNIRADGDGIDGDSVGGEPDDHARGNRAALVEVGRTDTRGRGARVLQADGKVAAD